MDDLSGIRVLVVDANSPWREFVKAQLLGRRASVVGTVADGWAALQQTLDLQPDVVIMDVWMERMNGIAATREIGPLVPTSKVLFISNESDPAVVAAAFKAGARGYLLKSLATIELVTAVETLVRGELFLGRGVTLG